MGVVLGREGGTWHWVRPQEGHVLTARQRDHTSPRLDGVAAPPHSWTEWPHVLTAGRSGLMSSWLDGVPGCSAGSTRGQRQWRKGEGPMF